MRTVRHQGYAQFGCGLTAPATWTNFDASPTLRLQRIPLLGRLLTRGRAHFPSNVRYGDIVRGLPVEPASCRAVYSSHVLEHLALEDCRAALRNIWTVLQPGGVFRFVIPDFDFEVRTYYLSDREPQPALALVRATGLGRETRPRGFRRLPAILADAVRNSRHLWAWDYRSMAVELEQAGFTGIRRAIMGDAADPQFRDVEEPGRWNDCLGIECRRPSL
jgi:SAM-dependent methyltransferase